VQILTPEISVDFLAIWQRSFPIPDIDLCPILDVPSPPRRSPIFGRAQCMSSHERRWYHVFCHCI
jgi:hypothetical protein